MAIFGKITHGLTIPMEQEKPHIKVKSMSLDQGHYGITTYNCSECGHDCEGHVEKCPKCGVVFEGKSTFEAEPYPFGGSDF